MKIGILGGTFNPIHAGHLLLAKAAERELGLDEVWFIPTGISYSKATKPVLPGDERLKMVELAIADCADFSGHGAMYQCMDIEIKREGYTYSFETLEELKEQYPEHAFYFLVGADCLFSIENWKEPQRFFDACILAAALRGDVRIDDMEKKRLELQARFDAKIVLFPFEPLELSSTEIRHKVCCGESISGLVPEKVREYIEEKGFYREEDIHCN